MRPPLLSLIHPSTMRGLTAAFVLAVPLAIIPPGSASAGVVDCTDASSCGITVKIGSDTVGSGVFNVSDGKIAIDPVQWIENNRGWVNNNGILTFTSDGQVVSLNSFSGAVDPSIIYGVGATNNSNTNNATYSFSFNTPLNGLKEPINASSFITTTLAPDPTKVQTGTMFTTSGTGFIADSQDINAAFKSVDKGVDIGTNCTLASPGGSCGSFSKSAVLNTGDGPYDTMSLIVAFGLSPNTAGTVSGNVIQVAVPEPSTYALIMAGLSFVGFVARRRLKR